MLIAGTLPGVIAGSVIRVELLPGEDVFDVVVAVVLIPLGCWLALTRPPAADVPAGPARVIPVPVLVALAVGVGCVGGIYGIGGGAILAPVLIGSGQRASVVAPAALASTFVTSVAGVTTFTLLSLYHPESSVPNRSSTVRPSARVNAMATRRDGSDTPDSTAEPSHCSRTSATWPSSWAMMIDANSMTAVTGARRRFLRSTP